MSELIWRGVVTGLSFHQYGRYLEHIQVGTQLKLEAVFNEHDFNAVAVMFHRDNGGLEQIGWIPKALNADLKRRLSIGQKLYAVVTQHNRMGDFNNRLFINVFDDRGDEPDDLEDVLITLNATKSTVVRKTTTSLQGIKMSAIDNVIANNKQAITAASYSEAGRLANKKAKEILAKKAPLMVRGYIDTPVGGIVIANLAVMAQQHFRPEDRRLARLAAAMQTTAYAELIQSFDIEEFIDGLLDNATIKKALKALDDKPAAKPADAE